jgi:hypothetical protein
VTNHLNATEEELAEDSKINGEHVQTKQDSHTNKRKLDYCIESQHRQKIQRAETLKRVAPDTVDITIKQPPAKINKSDLEVGYSWILVILISFKHYQKFLVVA